MKRPMSLRSEIVISTSLLVGAALVFVALLLLRMSEGQLLENAITSHTRTAQGIAALLDEIPLSKMSSRLNDIARIDKLKSWCLQRVNGETIGGDSHLLSPAAALQLKQTLRWQPYTITLHYPRNWEEMLFSIAPQHFVDIAVAVKSGTTMRAVLCLRYDLNTIHQQVINLHLLALACCLAYGLVLVGTAVFMLNRAVIRPIVSLTATSAAISSGELERRVELTGPREIVTLGQAFNNMAASLHRQLEELRATNEQLRIAHHHLAQSERVAAVGNLAAGIAHELGNPLSAVIGYLELVKRSADSDQLDMLERALHETGRMNKLVQEMLDFAAPAPIDDSGHCDTGAVINHSCALLRDQGVLKQRRFSCVVADNVGEAAIASHKLQQILINLIINAKDATAVDGTIELRASQVDAVITISVSDNGCGIAPEQLCEIFDPFFSTKATGRGRGLGLYISFQLARDCGGELTVTSQLNTGSCFTLSLPVHKG